jgi:hypothetical protein
MGRERNSLSHFIFSGTASKILKNLVPGITTSAYCIARQRATAVIRPFA